MNPTWDSETGMRSPTTQTNPTPRALRALERDLAAIPPTGDFRAGPQLRKLLEAACKTAAPHRAPWQGVLWHRSLGPVDLNKSPDALVVIVRATGDRFNLRWNGRRWDV